MASGDCNKCDLGIDACTQSTSTRCRPNTIQRKVWLTHAQLTHFPQSSFRIQAWHFIHLTPRLLSCCPCLVGLGEDVAVSSEEAVDAGDSGGVSSETVSRREVGGASSSHSWNPSNSSYKAKVAIGINSTHTKTILYTHRQRSRHLFIRFTENGVEIFESVLVARLVTRGTGRTSHCFLGPRGSAVVFFA